MVDKGGGMMSLGDKIKEQKERNEKFTENYATLTDIDKANLKEELDKAPCNIWGYMIELEARVKALETKIKGV